MTVLLEDGPDAGLVSHIVNPIAEQRLMESGGGALVLANRGVLTVSGPDRLTWLHSITSQALEALVPGVTTTTLVLSPTGHVEHVLHLVDDGTTTWAWTEAGRLAELVAWLDSMRFLLRVEVRAREDLTVLWIGREVDRSGVDAVRLDSEVAGGTELLVPRDALSSLLTEAGGTTSLLGATSQVGVRAWEALRIAAGVPRIGPDTDDRTIPNEIGLYGTHLDKGCYRGQETVARVHNLGRPPRRLTLLLIDGSPGDLPQPGPVTLGGRAVGALGTVGLHHDLGPVGLALLRRATPVDAVLQVDGRAASQEPLVDPRVGLHVRPIL